VTIPPVQNRRQSNECKQNQRQDHSLGNRYLFHHQAGRLEVHHRMPLSGALGIPTTSRGIQLQQRITLSMKAKRSKTQRLNAIASWDFSERAAEF
jgi:hypothetical protein